jgi:hypothetical protein
MDASQRRLTKGQTVRCRNGEQSLMGTVLMASEGNVQSVAVRLDNIDAVRVNDGLMITDVLPLTINYETETATDLWGNDWEIDVGDSQAS